MTDAYLLDPYQLNLSRYYQILRVAAVRFKEENHAWEERLAWHGWMTAAHNFTGKDKKAPDLKTWRKMVGVQDSESQKPATLDEEGKAELMEKAKRIMATDTLRTKSREGGMSERTRKKKEREAAREKRLAAKAKKE